MKLIEIEKFSKEVRRDVYTTKIKVQSFSRIWNCVLRLSGCAYSSICAEKDIYSFLSHDQVLELIFKLKWTDGALIKNDHIITLVDSDVQIIKRILF